ncbi:nuclear transport factor 2 family protein [Cryptosporangium phraense]|uniref:Nuclear transport factor 2 family protein n=1 Tax=Cryptosporangium phraense TaxID=2593070 RepID=A0A545AKT7_9ACTN|nr:nuclear transport factor 2 family protein [Cryptosporangium phraense]TQS41929.1 nuclear transport factor 2 family protein [Cryptosporangium phraense]
MDPTALDTLLAKQDISDLLVRYLRAIDRGDVAALEACYLPGATEDHGGLFEGSAADYVASIARTITHPRGVSTHAVTNVLIDVDGDRARAESYVLAFARVRRPDKQIGDTLTSARMIDDLERVDGRWGIRHRALRWDWNHDMEPAETWVFGMLGEAAAMKHSAKYPEDVVYAESGK